VVSVNSTGTQAPTLPVTAFLQLCGRGHATTLTSGCATAASG